MTDLTFLISKLNPLCRSAAERAAKLAVLHGHCEVDVDHLLFNLFENPRGDVRRAVEDLAIDAGAIAHHLKSGLSERPCVNTNKTPLLSDRFIQLLQAAWARSAELHLREIRSATLLLAFAETGMAAEFVQRVSTEFVKIKSSTLRDHLPALFSTEEGSVAADPQTPEANVPGALSQFTIDLTAAARAGALDPVLGRSAEIRQMIDILLRRRQNNPILTGEPGVGKTAIVEGFAIRVAAGDVPPMLRGVEVRTLDMGLLLAGASMRGEFEERLKGLMREVQSSPKPVVLFVDEAAETGVGARGTSHDCRHYLRRVPQIFRKGPGAGQAVSDDRRK
jgi:type VI secretion system protein VasG